MDSHMSGGLQDTPGQVGSVGACLLSVCECQRERVSVVLPGGLNRVQCPVLCAHLCVPQMTK